jgi:hypothetical protein
MSKKIREVNKYLYGCFAVEKEANLLYVTATRKLPSQQLSAITTALAYNHQKNAAVIQELLKPIVRLHLNSYKLSKEFKEGIGEISKLRNALDMRDNLEGEEINELLKNLTNVEDYLNDLYTELLESRLIENYSYTFSEVSASTRESIEYILQALKQDNLKHRDMLVESIFFNRKIQQRNEDTTPIVRYKNPDAWVQP